MVTKAVILERDDEKYFVLSEGDIPEKMVFTLQAALIAGYMYIDSFDSDGAKVRVIRRTDAKGWQVNYIRKASAPGNITDAAEC